METVRYIMQLDMGRRQQPWPSSERGPKSMRKTSLAKRHCLGQSSMDMLRSSAHLLTEALPLTHQTNTASFHLTALLRVAIPKSQECLRKLCSTQSRALVNCRTQNFFGDVKASRKLPVCLMQNCRGGGNTRAKRASLVCTYDRQGFWGMLRHRRCCQHRSVQRTTLQMRAAGALSASPASLVFHTFVYYL